MLAKAEKVSSRVYLKASPYKRTEIQISDQDYLVKEYYSSGDYRNRLTVLDKLFHHHEDLILSEKFLIDVMSDTCAQVRHYIMEHFERLGISKVIEEKLIEMAENDEKVTLRMLAIDKLATINPSTHYDLFFESALLKSNKESAAGLRGMLKVDPEKAYNMALFRIQTSSGELDLAITEVLLKKGSVRDLTACKKFISARKKFFKNRYVPAYLQFLSIFKDINLIEHHLEFICDSIQSDHNHTMTTMLVQDLYDFRRSVNQKTHLLHSQSEELIRLLTRLIDNLLVSPTQKTSG